jgi:formamidopyrimidine-DNA glycosylase
MPELPEVETVRRTLAPQVEGQVVVSVWVSGKPLRQRVVTRGQVGGPLVGQVIQRVDRRGKYLMLVTGRGGVLLHLGMSGRLAVVDTGGPRQPHTHLCIRLAGGREVRLVDPRRFGSVEPFLGATPPAAWTSLGPDPTQPAFTVAALATALARTRAAVRVALLDQRVVAGLGNIYVAEALFAARQDPASRSCDVRPAEVAALHRAIRRVVAQGIAHRGTTLKDYVDARGERGDHQRHLCVYGRSGEPCPRCAALIEARVLHGRTSYACPHCQGGGGRAAGRSGGAG